MEAPFTAYHNTPNKSVRQNVARRGVVLHHAAMTSLDYLRRLCMGEKQVSATAICKDDKFERLMDDGWRPWSLSSSYWDSAMRSVETANQSTDGWTVSDASHWSLAKGVAYWASIDGFWPHRDGDPKTWTVIGHREVYTIHGASYGTACPGGMDLNLVVQRAQAILKGAVPAGLDETPINEIPKGSENEMLMIHMPGAGAGGQYLFAIFGPNFWLEFVGDDVANGFIRQISPVASSVPVTKDFWEHCKASANAV